MSFNYLIEENILPVGPFSCKLLNYPLGADAMFCTQLLPELKADCKTKRGTDVQSVNASSHHLAVCVMNIKLTVAATINLQR